MLRSILLAVLALVLSSCAMVGPARLDQDEPGFEVLTEQIEEAWLRWGEAEDPKLWRNFSDWPWWAQSRRTWNDPSGALYLGRDAQTWQDVLAVLHAQRSASRVRNVHYVSTTSSGFTFLGPVGGVIGLVAEVVVGPIQWASLCYREISLDDDWLVRAAIDLATARRMGYASDYVPKYSIFVRTPQHLDEIGYDEAWLAERGITVPDVLAPDGTVIDERAAVAEARRAAAAGDDD
ncbi:hypothetical protein Pla163_37420 [Planctomycetes bacterium Pla163]|uniref:Lipoprotein n=1 Tax=Rohdeia mirabilis TaxID=2528008 RepID=A0A518D542_9BACT|nr:hypothetical protein Pla163_37420 [Planctomycetes bacterium Pla163]